MSAAETILPGAWPEDRGVLTDRLREARERHEMPSRARVVAWGEESSIEPLVAAGFEVVSVLSPAQALARVVRARQASAPAGTAIAAVSLNTHGAAIVIVAGTEVIHSRSFEWPLGAPFTGARPELLDRYLLVSQLAPQLQHAIALVRPVYGVAVTSIVACGNLPGLRSLAMLLIQEMDFEVETLDSADLLDAGHVDQALASLPQRCSSLLQWHRPASNVSVFTPSRQQHQRTAERDDRTSWMRLSIVTGLQHAAAVAALVLCATWSVLQMTGTSPAVAVFRDGQTSGAVEGLVVAVPPLPELRAEATTGRSTVESGTPALPADAASPMRIAAEGGAGACAHRSHPSTACSSPARSAWLSSAALSFRPAMRLAPGPWRASSATGSSCASLPAARPTWRSGHETPARRFVRNSRLRQGTSAGRQP